MNEIICIMYFRDYEISIIIYGISWKTENNNLISMYANRSTLNWNKKLSLAKNNLIHEIGFQFKLKCNY